MSIDSDDRLFPSESDRAEARHARARRADEIMAGNPDGGACRFPTAKFCVCDHCMRQTANLHRDADRDCGREWSCTCAACRNTRLLDLTDADVRRIAATLVVTPAESRALARAADEDVAADDQRREYAS